MECALSPEFQAGGVIWGKGSENNGGQGAWLLGQTVQGREGKGWGRPWVQEAVETGEAFLPPAPAPRRMLTGSLLVREAYMA